MSEFAVVPAGYFLMGGQDGQEDERPVHRVWVDTFELGIYPVTRRQYAEFLAATGYHAPREWTSVAFSRLDLPVVGVSWNDAQAYCAWRSATRQAVRLPTEAEWERAARGAHEAWRYPWGDSIPGWVPNDGKGPLEAPWPVSLGDPNKLGIYGITANVHEWCADWHSRNFYAVSPERNPTGPAEGTRRVSRGGSWRHAFTISRTAARSKLDPAFRYTDYGFRVARSRDVEFGIRDS